MPEHHCLPSCLVWRLCPVALSSFWQRAISSVSWCSTQWRAWLCWWVALLISLTTLSRLPSANESLCPLLRQLGFSPATPSNGPESCQSRPWPGLWWLLQWCDREVGLSIWTKTICQNYCLLALQMSSCRWSSNSLTNTHRHAHTHCYTVIYFELYCIVKKNSKTSICFHRHDFKITHHPVSALTW